MPDLSETHVLMIAADGFEEPELVDPRQSLIDAGARVSVASIKKEPIQGVRNDLDKAETLTPDLALADVDVEDYDALVIPGGVASPDKLRLNEDAVEIVQDFMDDGKPVAAICHGPWLLAEADVIDGRRMTGFPSIRTDLRNAGAEVVDEEVVVDDNLITSRNPDDIPAFTRAIIEKLKQPAEAA